MLLKGKANLEYQSGEVTEVRVIEVRKKTGHRNFFLTFEAGMEDLVKQNLSGMDFKVLLLMMSLMDWDNVVQHTQREIADMLKTSPEVISRSVARLKAIDAIRDARHVGKARFYRLNPYLASKASSSNHNEVLRMWDKVVPI